MNVRRVSIAAIIVGLVPLVYVAATQAASGFSSRSIRGTYGLSGSGTVGFGTTQAAVVGLNSFDRGGACDITAKVNAGGAVTALTTAHCSYTVNADGTAFLDVTFNEAPFIVPFHSDFVLVDGARELLFVLSDKLGGTVASGVAKRQSPNE